MHFSERLKLATFLDRFMETKNIQKTTFGTICALEMIIDSVLKEKGLLKMKENIENTLRDQLNKEKDL